MKFLIKFICYFVAGTIFDVMYLNYNNGLKIFSKN
jgi:hypothetical protein